MELMSLGGLLFAGNYMNKRDDKKKLDKKKRKIEEKIKESQNYNNNQVPTNINEINAVAEKRFADSQDTEKSGVVPRFYSIMKNTPKKLRTNVENDIDNQYKQYRRAEHFGSLPSSPTNFLKTESQLNNNEHFENIINSQKPEFLNQFNEMTFNNPNLPSPSGEGIGTDIDSPPMRQGIEKEIVQTNNLNTVPVYRGDNLVIPRMEVENNFQQMQPMFRKSGKLRAQHGGMVNQRVMELFTGDIHRDDWHAKQETEPFFSPIIGFTNTSGMPVMTDFLSSRYIPTKERRNEKPFQPTKVNPGLNLGTNEIGQDGYHDKFRYLPKTVNEMRTLGDHQKTTFGCPVIPGMKGQRGPIIGKTSFKEIHARTKANNLGDVMLGLSSDTKAMRTRDNYEVQNLATKNRGVDYTPHIGPAQYMVTRNTPDYVREKYRKTAKQNFLQDPPTNVHLIEGMSNMPYNLQDWQPNMTQRGINDKNPYIGPAYGGDRTGANYVIKYLNEVPDCNNRAIYNKYDRSGNAISGNMYKAPAENFNDVHDLQKREIHNKFDRAGNAVTGNMYKAPAEDFNDVHDLQKKAIYNKYDRMGNAITGNMYKAPAEDFNDVHDLQKREIHNKFDRAGNAITGNMYKAPAEDFNDVHDLQKREIHNKFDRAGNAVTGNMYKAPAEDFNDVHDLQKREIHNKYDRAGNAVTGNMYKAPAEDFNDVHDLTKREINCGELLGPPNHDTKQGYVLKYVDWVPEMTAREMFNGELLGPANHDTKQGYVLKYVDWVPEMTEREQHAKNKYIGPYRDYVGGNRSRADANNMLLNTSKEFVQQSRVPNKGGYNKGYTNMFTGHEFKADCEFPRALAPNDSPHVTDKIKFTETRVPNYKWYVNRRINSLALDNLKKNPYINNVTSKAVTNNTANKELETIKNKKPMSMFYE
jgi:hypothetical protein